MKCHCSKSAMGFSENNIYAGTKALKNNLLTAISVTTSRFLSTGVAIVAASITYLSAISHNIKKQNETNSRLQFKTLADTKLSGEKTRHMPFDYIHEFHFTILSYKEKGERRNEIMKSKYKQLIGSPLS